MNRIFHFIPLLVLFSACATTGTVQSPYPPSDTGPTLSASLFPTDQSVISQAAIDTILQSKIRLPESARASLINFSSGTGSSSFGYGYSRSESVLKMQQSYIDSLSSGLMQTGFLESVILLPSMLTPQSPTIPVLREAAVRVQSPILIIFQIQSDTYQEYRIFRSSRAKAYATIEFVLLDVRTGIIPFTAIVTEEFETAKSDTDSNIEETMRRAENEATLRALASGISQFDAYFSSQ